MAGQSLNFFALYTSINRETTLYSLMTLMGTLRNISFQWLNSWRKRGSFCRANSINGNHLSSCMSWRNTSRKMVLSTCAGAATIKWQSKNESSSIKMQKAQIWRLDLLYTHRCMVSECTSIIAFYAIYCNTLMGCYV